MNNNRRNKIVSLIFLILFMLFFFYVLERDKAKRIEKNILDFQTEYKEYINKDERLDMTFLEKISNSDFFKSTALAEHFEKVKSDAFKNFKNDYLKQIYNYNFLKNQNTVYYTIHNKESFQKLISESDELIARLEDNKNVTNLIKLKNNNKSLLVIVKNELGNDRLIMDKFRDAQNNRFTENTISNDCFSEQINYIWKYDEEISKKMCTQLNLLDCNTIFTKSKENDDKKTTFYGYTRNNPRKVNSKRPYLDYVSFSDSDFRDASSLKKLGANYKIYPEVYYREVNGRKIYKYNVIALPVSYQLSCSSPK